MTSQDSDNARAQQTFVLELDLMNLPLIFVLHAAYQGVLLFNQIFYDCVLSDVCFKMLAVHAPQFMYY